MFYYLISKVGPLWRTFLQYFIFDSCHVFTILYKIVDNSGLTCPYSFEMTVREIILWIIRQDPAARFHLPCIPVQCSMYPRRNKIKIQVCLSDCRKISRCDEMFLRIFIIICHILAQRYKEHVHSSKTSSTVILQLWYYWDQSDRTFALHVSNNTFVTSP